MATGIIVGPSALALGGRGQRGRRVFQRHGVGHDMLDGDGAPLSRGWRVSIPKPPFIGRIGSSKSVRTLRRLPGW